MEWIWANELKAHSKIGKPMINVVTPLNDGEDITAPVEDSASIKSRLTGIEDKLRSLRELFEQRIQFDEAKDHAFNTLYKKLRESEADYQSSLKKSLVLSLLLLHDRMQKAESDPQDTNLQRNLHLRRELLDILYAEGVEPIETQSDVFDRSRQEVLRTVPTIDPAKDNTVDESVREGFLISGKVLRPQSVIVRRFQVAESKDTTETVGA